MIQFIVWDSRSNMFRRDFEAEVFFNDFKNWWESKL
jgi:hypothetical protein